MSPPRRAPGVYPIPSATGGNIPGRYEVVYPDGTVENIMGEGDAPLPSAPLPQAPDAPAPAAQGLSVEIGQPVEVPTPRARNPLAGRGPTAPGMSPRPFESLAAYAPADSGEKLAAMPAEVPQNGDSGGPMGAVQKLAMGGAAPDGIHPALAPLRDTGLKLAQKAARERALLANLTRAGGMMIGRGNDAAYSTLDRAAGQPVEDFLQQQQLDSQAASAQAQREEAARRAGLEERAMALKERPEPEDPFAERKVRADEMRARAAMISAGRPPGTSLAQDFRQMQADERDLQRLGKDTEDMAALAPDMQRLLDAAGQEGDIAGAGILGSRAPGFMLDQEGIQNRQAAMRVASALLKEVSGAAVTPQEAERFMQGRGLGPGATEAQFRAGARALASELAGRLRAKQGKYRPELVGTLRSRGGFTADQLPDAGAAPGGAADKVEVIAPDGRRMRVPKAKLQAALAAGGRLP